MGMWSLAALGACLRTAMCTTTCCTSQNSFSYSPWRNARQSFSEASAASAGAENTIANFVRQISPLRI